MSEFIKKYRCAIYTRKSHEEGLEQAFNSLDAQRESGEAYIQSQKHQNCLLITKYYDDGGFSGGNIDRPALQALLSDIKHNKIDIIVVYKVDRLSRSLGDFAKLMDIFDQHKVSFVSVTQQFNTTSSMGRLTLNMLLSFAQFEREVTGERIRDKFAASKKKGLWMGGSPPLGYRIKNRRLEIIEEEVKIVQSIFQKTMVGTAPLVIATQLNERNITTKAWISQKGNSRGGNYWTPKQIYRILTNPIYIGKVKHKETHYKGEHQSIITDDVWNTVKSIMTQNHKPAHPSIKKVSEPFPLKTLVKTETGSALSPSTTKGIRYYVSQDAIKHGFKNCPIKSLNAKRLEELIIAYVLNSLPELIKQYVLNKYQQSENEAWSILRTLIFEVKISTRAIWVVLQQNKIRELTLILEQQAFRNTQNDKEDLSSPFDIMYPSQVIEDEIYQTIRLDIQIKRHDGKRWILSKDGKLMFITNHKKNPLDNAILNAIAEAYVWKEQLIKEQISVKQLAQKLSINPNFIYKRLKLLSLSSTILKQITSNSLSPMISIKDLYQASDHLCWQKQHQFLAIQ
ncbi:hypothetical protein BMR02_12415 [Methylococcaceae bacterium HT1]|nr:hypothetical protein BMR02_12415 [Methylococcaceae bacterium HT1]